LWRQNSVAAKFGGLPDCLKHERLPERYWRRRLLNRETERT
jgi:hypothetical protein